MEQIILSKNNKNKQKTETKHGQEEQVWGSRRRGRGKERNGMKTKSVKIFDFQTLSSVPESHIYWKNHSNANFNM